MLPVACVLISVVSEQVLRGRVVELKICITGYDQVRVFPSMEALAEQLDYFASKFCPIFFSSSLIFQIELFVTKSS